MCGWVEERGRKGGGGGVNAIWFGKIDELHMHDLLLA